MIRTCRAVMLTVAPFLLVGPMVAVAQEPEHDAPADQMQASELFQVTANPDEGSIVIRVGPVALDASAGHVRLPIETVEIPVAGWLHGFDWNLEDGDGRPLPADLLHHVNLIDPDRRELFTPVARRIMAAGRETPGQQLPKMIGYPLESGTRLLVLVMLATPEEDLDEVYLNVRLSYTDLDLAAGEPRTMYPFWVDVTGPVGAKDFPLPPGRTVVAWEGSPAIDATIMALGGHLHDYGEEIRLEDVTEGSVLWSKRPEATADGHLTTMGTDVLIGSGGIKLVTSHTYRIVVEYENPLSEAAPEAGMGAIGGIVLAESGIVFPPLDPDDEDYRADLKNTMESPSLAGHAAVREHQR
ncbi:MAG: hypothetical protein ACC682_07880 [Gemmatimonadota bacterium]